MASNLAIINCLQVRSVCPHKNFGSSISNQSTFIGLSESYTFWRILFKIIIHVLHTCYFAGSPFHTLFLSSLKPLQTYVLILIPVNFSLLFHQQGAIQQESLLYFGVSFTFPNNPTNFYGIEVSIPDLTLYPLQSSSRFIGLSVLCSSWLESDQHTDHLLLYRVIFIQMYKLLAL